MIKITVQHTIKWQKEHRTHYRQLIKTIFNMLSVALFIELIGDDIAYYIT